MSCLPRFLVNRYYCRAAPDHEAIYWGSYLTRVISYPLLGFLFRDAACGAIEGASQGGAALAYGEGRIVGILPGHSRLKTFAIIEKLRRALPMLAQSFDCILQPDFDVLEYAEGTGIAGVMAQLVTRPLMPMRDAA